MHRGSLILALVLSLPTLACSKAEAPSSAASPPPSSTTPVAPAAADSPAPPQAAAPVDGRVAISVTEDGFQPAQIHVERGKPVKLAFTRVTDKTCAKEVVLELGGGQQVKKELPLNQTVEIDATFASTGELKYACSMDMIKGVISVH